LVAIESMATGTPIIGRRAGGLTETVEHGITGFLVDDLTEAQLAVQNAGRLPRRAVRERVIERFLPSRMAEEYERVYRRLVDLRSADASVEALSTFPKAASDPTESIPRRRVSITGRTSAPSVTIVSPHTEESAVR
jgi:hypothetical protein